VVKEQLKETLGITGDLMTHESAAGYKMYGTARAADAEGDWGLGCQGEGMVVLDADAVLGGVYRPGGTRNYTDWSHPKVEELFQKQKVEQDLDKRREYLREIADIIRVGDNHWVTLVGAGSSGRCTGTLRASIRPRPSSMASSTNISG
jgi:ABC-type transport system substrate-binding protein